MIVVDAAIRIDVDVDHVFAYVSDPERLPEWNSAVTDVQPRTDATYLLSRQLPTGAATNELRVVAAESPSRFAIQTTSGPTPFLYEFTFSEDENATRVALNARADLGPLASLLGPLARHGLENGIRANLRALKTVLETRTQR